MIKKLQNGSKGVSDEWRQKKEYRTQEDSQDIEKRRVPAVKRDSKVDEKIQSYVETKEER